MALSTLLVADRDTEAPNTAMVDTNARPTMSADEVWAVRLGLLIEFSRPSLPAIPSIRANGRPSTLDIGRATTGASMPIPMNPRTAPSPTSWMAGAVSPSTSRITPTRPMTEPMMIRRRDDSVPSVPWSDRAATGGMRTARRAGLMADTTVTPTPTTRAATTVLDSNTSGPVGRVIPNAFNSASSPSAASTPRPRPTSDATIPTMPASRSTERNT